MRISTSQIFQTGISAMQRASVELNKTNLQMATGRRILNPSDDPAGATRVMHLESAVNQVEQHQRNSDLAQPRLELEEAQLDSYETYLQRIRELVVASGNSTYNQENRLTFATEIRGLRDEIMNIANSKDANGEYLFAGTDSHTKPFEETPNGVAYFGADGEGSVRKVAITATRSIAIGDTGKSIFMDVPERGGQSTQAVLGVANTGSLSVVSSVIKDETAYAASADEVYTIEFGDYDTDGTVDYQIRDSAGNLVPDDLGNAITNVTASPFDVQIGGRTITLDGVPQDGDTVTSRPTPYVSIFDTLDAIATALETPATDDDGREAFSDAVSLALTNIDSGMDRMNEVRTSVGYRLASMDTQATLNDQHLLDLQTSLSDVRDLDYAEAISRYKQQETVLQAAQQTYAQVTKLSLFNFL